MLVERRRLLPGGFCDRAGTCDLGSEPLSVPLAGDRSLWRDAKHRYIWKFHCSTTTGLGAFSTNSCAMPGLCAAIKTGPLPVF